MKNQDYLHMPMHTAPRSTIYRHYAPGLVSPGEVINDARADCRELWDRSEMLFPIGRVCGTYGSVRFRVERRTDRAYEWFLSDGVKFSKCRMSDLKAALEYEFKVYS